ncbi:hypothetical protein EWB00_000776 [Schistosoma japonicum]|uniref:Uncharacterized protein n=1 Tax=Schistosoma japonicum TaxID=6182 RepID=A0A4Z2CKV3_SCHJA|nr:hypothetical protein EWB00_000776 [Schistosoma japonicum]
MVQHVLSRDELRQIAQFIENDEIELEQTFGICPACWAFFCSSALTRIERGEEADFCGDVDGLNPESGDVRLGPVPGRNQADVVAPSITRACSCEPGSLAAGCEVEPA